MIFSPSQIILIVTILGLRLLPYRIFLIDDGGRPDIVAKALMVIPRSLQSCNIQLRTAIVVFIAYPPLRN